MKLQLIIVFSCILTLKFACCDDELRKIKASINPGCDQQPNVTCDKFSLIYVEAESETNKLHYLWDFTSYVSILIARTSKDASLSINYTLFESNIQSVNFTEEPDYVFSSVISSFYMFNDTKDGSNVSDPANLVHRIDPLKLIWNMNNPTINATNNEIFVLVNASTGNNGSFTIKFTAYGFSQHGEDLPHLYHTSNSMQIDIIADKVQTNFTSPRIAIELLMISTEDQKEGSYKLNRIRNLDDEFTPGIFDVYNILSPRSNNDTKGGYIQFRPVCYNSRRRTVSSSTESRFSDLINLKDDTTKFEHSLPFSFFNQTQITNSLKEAFNITFGMSGDGFYSRTNYISFSYAMGLGVPPKEALSKFVVTFAIIGLGIPLLVLIIGGSYVAMKRYRN